MDFKTAKKNSHIHMTPKNGKYSHIIIFLHGLGDCPDSYEDFFKESNALPEDIPIKIICLQSPFLFTQGFPMPSWFTITNFPIVSEKCYNFEEAKNSVKIIESVIEEEVKLINGKYENIFVGGFSQGACLSLYIGLTYKHLLGGVLVLSGALFPQTKILDTNKELKIFVGHGSNDPVIPLKSSEESMKPIEKFTGFNRYIYPGQAHCICQKEIQDLKNFLKKYMSGK